MNSLQLMAQLTLFIPVALLITIAPGPDNLAILAIGLSRGRAASLGFALGCAAGCVNHTILAVIGVSALIAASPLAFAAMQYAGAAYLVWIGVRALRSQGGAKLATRPEETQIGHFGVYFRRGLLANAINPKVALFFLAFLPQFVRPEVGPVALQLALLGIVFGLCAACVFALLALFSGRFGALLQTRPALSRWLDRATGVMFVGLGLRLALGDLGRAH